MFGSLYGKSELQDEAWAVACTNKCYLTLHLQHSFFNCTSRTSVVLFLQINYCWCDLDPYSYWKCLGCHYTYYFHCAWYSTAATTTPFWFSFILILNCGLLWMAKQNNLVQFNDCLEMSYLPVVVSFYNAHSSKEISKAFVQYQQ